MSIKKIGLNESKYRKEEGEARGIKTKRKEEKEREKVKVEEKRKRNKQKNSMGIEEMKKKKRRRRNSFSRRKMFKFVNDRVISGMKGSHEPVPPRKGVGIVIVEMAMVLVMESGTNHGERVAGSDAGKVFIACMASNAGDLIVEFVDDQQQRVNGQNEGGHEEVGLFDEVAHLRIRVVGPGRGHHGQMVVGVIFVEPLGVQQAVAPVEPGVIQHHGGEESQGRTQQRQIVGCHRPAFGLAKQTGSQQPSNGGQGGHAGFDFHGHLARLDGPALDAPLRMVQV